MQAASASTSVRTSDADAPTERMTPSSRRRSATVRKNVCAMLMAAIETMANETSANSSVTSVIARPARSAPESAMS